MERNAIAYRRISADRQEESASELKAQDAVIDAYCKANGNVVVSTYTEIETAKGEMKERPELVKAITHTQRENATLVIAKFELLTRSVYVTALLDGAGVEFVACEQPYVNHTTIGFLADRAKRASQSVSEYTKAALASYKEDKRVSKRIRLLYPGGVPPDVVEATAGKLGASLPQCRSLTHEARAKGAAKSAVNRRAVAMVAVEELAPRMLAMWKNEKLSLRAIGNRLNEEGRTTRAGKPWSPTAVKRVLDRAQEA
jgi:DNA invertase Pin-like site-specific DNA recombinase